MNIILAGKNLDDIRPLLQAHNFREISPGSSDTPPELVITHGGDGALLGAERDFPGIPKLPLRDARTAPLCPRHRAELQLEAFLRGETPLTELPLVFARSGTYEVYALNDVFLHNQDRGSALRYRVRIDGELYAGEVVGDGVGIAGVHGSTAYYRSITHSLFRVGIGLAFSNSTEEVNHLVLSESSLVEIEIVRGPGILIADNSPDQRVIAEGERVIFGQSPERRAQIYGLANFMCPQCRVLRHPNRLPFRGVPF